MAVAVQQGGRVDGAVQDVLAALSGSLRLPFVYAAAQEAGQAAVGSAGDAGYGGMEGGETAGDGPAAAGGDQRAAVRAAMDQLVGEQAQQEGAGEDGLEHGHGMVGVEGALEDYMPLPLSKKYGKEGRKRWREEQHSGGGGGRVGGGEEGGKPRSEVGGRKEDAAVKRAYVELGLEGEWAWVHVSWGWGRRV